MPEGAARREESSRRAKPARNNRARILDASLELFNERGTFTVSTSTVAAHLGISPGNLYYHFANKEQIIRELWAQIEEASLPTIDIPEDGGLLPPAGLAEFFVGAIDTMWRYRFFFRDIDELVARDPEFGKSFQAETQVGRRHLVGLFNSLIANGAMSAPPERRDLERLGDNIQLLVLNWLRFVTTSLGNGQSSVSADDITEGVLHIFVMLEPYLEDSYATQVRSVLQQRIKARGPIAATGLEGTTKAAAPKTKAASARGSRAAR